MFFFTNVMIEYQKFRLFAKQSALLKTWTVNLRRKKACPERSRRSENPVFHSGPLLSAFAETT